MKYLILFLTVIIALSCSPNLPSDLPSLMVAMGDYDMNRSWHATEKVRKLYGKEGLLKALQHSNEYTRFRAAHSLMFYPGSDVEQALMIASKDPCTQVRMWTAWSLGEQGKETALPTLKVLSHDPDNIVREYAMEAAGKVTNRIKVKQ